MTPTTQPAIGHPGQSLPDPADPRGNPSYVLWRDFKPRDRGVLDLIDDMFAHLIQDRLRIIWVPGTVTEYPLVGGEPRSFEFAFRNSIFRLIMARMAVLCSEFGSQPVSPYGGTGQFVDPRWPDIRFHVDFMNTPGEQRLELTPITSPESP
jgi:hypothetical protein